MSGKHHILVAEDETNSRLALYIILTKAGYKVTMVEDGRRALERIVALKKSARPVDFLLTDWWMPGLTGIELMEELANKNISLPTLVITGFDDPKNVIEPLKKKSVAYLKKPFEHQTLIDRIGAVIEKEKRLGNGAWRMESP